MKSKEIISKTSSMIQDKTKERFKKEKKREKEIYAGVIVAKGSLGLPWRSTSD